VQADLYETLGTIYRKLGKFDRADSLLHSALDRRQAANRPDQSAIAGNLLAIGMLRVDQARLPDAERLIRKTLAMEQRYLPDDHLAIARATAALARVLEERGQYEKAVELLTQALRLESPQDAASADVAEILTLLADAHFYLGHYAICDSLNRKILMMRQQLNGPQHPRVAGVFINLGNVKIQTGRYAEAEQDFRRALAIDQAWYGKDHPETARAETYVAQALNWENRYEESRNLLQLALSTTEQAYGKMHPRVALVLSNLGVVALQLGKLDDAEIDFSRMTRIYQAAYGDQHQFTALAENNLASVYLKKKEFARAERVLNDVIRVYDRVLPAGHFNTGVAQIKLGRALVGQKRYTEAEGHTLAGYEILVKQVTPSNDFLQGARADLIRIYESLRQRQKVVRFRAELAANQPNKIDPAGGR
jgi:serine/threonine-protein kinase